MKHRLEKVCRSPWGKMNILPTPFVLLMRHEHFYEEHVLCEKSLGQGLKFSSSSLVGVLQPAHVPCRHGHEFQLKELRSGLAGAYSLHKSPLYFSRSCTFLQTSMGSRGQCAVPSLFPLNLVWDLFLGKIAAGSKKPSSRTPFLSVCFHPCLGNTMNADVVGNF